MSNEECFNESMWKAAEGMRIVFFADFAFFTVKIS
jgi:hypothetical protein